MDKIYLQLKDVNEFFEELHTRCKQKKSYSIMEIIQEMGVTFKDVEVWIKSNHNWAYILQLCRELCCLNVQDAELSGDLSREQSIKYLLENRSSNH
jgi:L-lactate utilization protein LutC